MLLFINVNRQYDFFDSEYAYSAISHLLHCYQDNFGLYQDQENYNFKNLIQTILQKDKNRQNFQTKTDKR